MEKVLSTVARFPIIVGFALLALSCKKQAAAVSNSQPKPTMVYGKGAASLASYDYQSFEPFLNMQNDTTYVVNFWATWCQPCIEELPYFEQLNAQYKSQKVKVILVSLDMKKQVVSHLLPFIAKNNLQSQVVHLSDPDANAWIGKVDSTWSGAIPATIIYNRNRRQFYEQSFTFEQLKAEITPLINQ